MNPMLPSLLLNIAIVIMIGMMGIVTANPLAMLGLLLLRDMPVIMEELDDPEERQNAIGFTN